MNVDTIHDYAVRLRELGMLQAAGDYDYFVAWIKSIEWTGGTAHLKPNPAGAATIDENSNNCPIPYIVSYDSVKGCANENLEEAKTICQSVNNILDSLKIIYSTDVEWTAIAAYIDYTDDLITELTKLID